MMKFVLALAILCTSAFAEDLALSGFQKRFQLIKNDQGKVIAIRLKKVVNTFTVRPLIEQLKSDFEVEQRTGFISDQEIDDMFYDMGIDPYLMAQEGSEEAQKLKASILNIANVDVNKVFAKLDKGDFWKEFQKRINEAFLFIDPTILVNLEDPRFFYKRAVTHQVVIWALNEAKKRFSDVPALNIASFIIVRIHDMMLEQRHFHHNMLLHYFQKIPEGKLGLTKEEMDRTVSSIFEYRIDYQNILESNRAAKDWLNYGVNNFYAQVRQGKRRALALQGKELNFAFAQVKEKDKEIIYHLHHMFSQYSRRPAMAYDLSNPKRIKRFRLLLNLGGAALGFIQMPGWLKVRVEAFVKSMYVEQVRMEGALVGYFESQGDAQMVSNIYKQRANFYIVE